MGTEFLHRDGGVIAYDDTGGTGQVVLCAPGMGDLRGGYRFLAPRLAAAGHRVVTMDLRGHGESSAGWADYSPRAVGEDMLALLRHLGPDRRSVLIGSSFTPASAIWAAAEAPEEIAGIVLCAPFADDPALNPVMRALAALVGRSARLWSWFYRSLYRTAVPPDLAAYRKALRRNLAQPGRMAALRAMMWASKQECNARLPEVRCPVLIVMGAKDPDFPDPEAEARRVAGRATDATVVMVPGAGHYPQAEMPDQVSGALLPFLARVRDGRGDA